MQAIAKGDYSLDITLNCSDVGQLAEESVTGKLLYDGGRNIPVFVALHEELGLCIKPLKCPITTGEYVSIKLPKSDYVKLEPFSTLIFRHENGKVRITVDDIISYLGIVPI